MVLSSIDSGDGYESSGSEVETDGEYEAPTEFPTDLFMKVDKSKQRKKTLYESSDDVSTSSSSSSESIAKEQAKQQAEIEKAERKAKRRSSMSLETEAAAANPYWLFVESEGCEPSSPPPGVKGIVHDELQDEKKPPSPPLAEKEKVGEGTASNEPPSPQPARKADKESLTDAEKAERKARRRSSMKLETEAAAANPYWLFVESKECEPSSPPPGVKGIVHDDLQDEKKPPSPPLTEKEKIQEGPASESSSPSLAEESKTDKASKQSGLASLPLDSEVTIQTEPKRATTEAKSSSTPAKPSKTQTGSTKGEQLSPPLAEPEKMEKRPTGTESSPQPLTKPKRRQSGPINGEQLSSPPTKPKKVWRPMDNKSSPPVATPNKMQRRPTNSETSSPPLAKQIKTSSPPTSRQNKTSKGSKATLPSPPLAPPANVRQDEPSGSERSSSSHTNRREMQSTTQNDRPQDAELLPAQPMKPVKVQDKAPAPKRRSRRDSRPAGTKATVQVSQPVGERLSPQSATQVKGQQGPKEAGPQSPQPGKQPKVQGRTVPKRRSRRDSLPDENKEGNQASQPNEGVPRSVEVPPPPPPPPPPTPPPPPPPVTPVKSQENASTTTRRSRRDSLEELERAEPQKRDHSPSSTDVVIPKPKYGRPIPSVTSEEESSVSLREERKTPLLKEMEDESSISLREERKTQLPKGLAPQQNRRRTKRSSNSVSQNSQAMSVGSKAMSQSTMSMSTLSMSQASRAMSQSTKSASASASATQSTRSMSQSTKSLSQSLPSHDGSSRRSSGAKPGPRIRNDRTDNVPKQPPGQYRRRSTQKRPLNGRKKQPNFHDSMPDRLDFSEDPGNKMDASGTGPRGQRRRRTNLNASMPNGLDFSEANGNEMDGVGRSPRGGRRKLTAAELNSSLSDGLDFSDDQGRKTDDSGRSGGGAPRRRRRSNLNASMPNGLDLSETNGVGHSPRGGRRRRADLNGSMPDPLDLSAPETMDGSTPRGRGPPRGRASTTPSSSVSRRSPSGSGRFRSSSRDANRRSPSTGGRFRGTSPSGMHSKASSTMDTSMGASGTSAGGTSLRRYTGVGPARRRSRDFNASMSDRMDNSSHSNRRRPSQQPSVADQSTGQSLDDSRVTLKFTKTDEEALLEVMSPQQVYDLYFPEVGHFDWKKWRKSEEKKEERRRQSATRRRPSADRPSIQGKGTGRQRQGRRISMERSRRRSTLSRGESKQQQAAGREEQSPKVALEEDTTAGFQDFGPSPFKAPEAAPPVAPAEDFASFDNIKTSGAGEGGSSLRRSRREAIPTGSLRGPERSPKITGPMVGTPKDSKKASEGKESAGMRRVSSFRTSKKGEKGGNELDRSGHLVRQDSATKELNKLATFMRSIDVLSHPGSRHHRDNPEPKEAKCCIIL